MRRVEEAVKLSNSARSLIEKNCAESRWNSKMGRKVMERMTPENNLSDSNLHPGEQIVMLALPLPFSVHEADEI